ncbi:MAG: serine protease AprX [Polaribacter sp.]|jgi:serine protease AprX
MTFKTYFLFLSAICFSLYAQAQATEQWSSKVDPSLLVEVEEGNTVDFLIVLKEQRSLNSSPTKKTKEEKGRYVFEQLQKVAKESQQSLRSFLESKNITYQSFFIINSIYTKGKLTLIKELASRNDVAQIQNNPEIKMEEPELVLTDVTNGASQRTDAEWGLKMIGADKVWDMGIRGEGVVVAGQDTGYEWEHITLKEKYRGWDGTDADHNYNWHDAIHVISLLHGDTIVMESLNSCGLNSLVPCDDHNHGTHTMGTMLGSDADHSIGVAPNAKWIACRNMERGYGSPVSYIECYEWMLAPTDLNNANPDPYKSPHVINNSWSCPEMEGCNEGNWATMNTVVDNLKAAGIVVVVSAGNSGSQGCESINAPSAMFDNSFTIGASMEADTIAHFSSRGPVTVDGSGRMKPNVIAPGFQVLSSIRNNGFARFNGTSMSGPHVAGAVALIISANKDLAGQVEAIENILESTAVAKTNGETCGGLSADAVPNHIAGYGRIDVLAAVEKALAMKAAVQDNEDGVAVLVRPNPARDLIQFELQNFKGATTIDIFDAAGRLLITEELQADVFEVHSMSLARLMAGVYFYQVRNEERFVEGKIVRF